LRSQHRPLSLALFVALLAAFIGATPAAASSATVIRNGDRGAKVIALTFDDGWSDQRTAEIVAILDRYGAPATFFPYTSAVQASPDLWRSIADRFPVGNHTVTHTRLTGLSASAIYAEIQGATMAFERSTGRPMVRLFRPPYGRQNSTVAREAFRAGYRHIVTWDVDSRDWKRPGDDVVLRRATGGQNGSIILLHAGPPVTVRVLPAVIRHYQSLGFSFVTVPELLGMDWSPADADRPRSVPEPRLTYPPTFLRATAPGSPAA
jgi:peptidoglycan-N-acetylglucosamine deacetylase